MSILSWRLKSAQIDKINLPYKLQWFFGAQVHNPTKWAHATSSNFWTLQFAYGKWKGRELKFTQTVGGIRTPIFLARPFVPTLLQINSESILSAPLLLHADTFAHRPLHTEAFTHRRFYTQTLLGTKLLQTDIFTHRRDEKRREEKSRAEKIREEKIREERRAEQSRGEERKREEKGREEKRT